MEEGATLRIDPQRSALRFASLSGILRTCDAEAIVPTHVRGRADCLVIPTGETLSKWSRWPTSWTAVAALADDCFPTVNVGMWIASCDSEKCGRSSISGCRRARIGFVKFAQGVNSIRPPLHQSRALGEPLRQNQLPHRSRD